MKEEKKSTIDQIVDQVKNTNTEPKKERDPLYFVLGALFVIVGIFILSRKVIVSTFTHFSMFGWDFSSGLLVFPLLFGIAWMAYNPKSIWAKLLSIIGMILIIVAIIMSVSIHLVAMTLFDYIMIIGMIAIGAGFLFRYYFKRA